MESDVIEERRQDREKIRNSFLMKLLIAAALFGAFVFCDRNHATFRGYTAEAVAEAVAETVTAEKILEKIFE